MQQPPNRENLGVRQNPELRAGITLADRRELRRLFLAAQGRVDAGSMDLFSLTMHYPRSEEK